MMKIDPLLFLVLIEAAVVFFGLALIFLFRTVKYRKLYESTRAALDARNAEVPEPAPVPVAPEPAPAETVVAEELPSPVEDVPANVRKLLEIIDFQKQKIIELLCMRDMLDDAYRQLDMLRQKNVELESRIVGLVESAAQPEAFSEASSMLQESNQSLGNYLSVLQRNSVSLGEKMVMWEDQLKVLWEDARRIADEIPGGEVVMVEGEASAEVSRLTSELENAEAKLKAAQDELASLKTQYEDIEKEYMILYSKQQAGTLGQ